MNAELSVTHNPNLDRIRLDDFEVIKPSGAKYKPHAGQSVWVHGYGLSAEDKAAVATELSNDSLNGNERLTILCDFVASEVVRWDVKSPRTGEELPAPSPDSVKKLPDELLGFITRRVLGIETEGEG